MNRRSHEQVDLAALLEAPAVAGLRAEYLAQAATRVESVALVSSIDDVTTVRADTLVVVADDPGLGPWMISAALRYAWERRASGLVVAQDRISDVEKALAERLDVSLLGSSAEASKVAIELAMRLGVAKAGQLSSVHQFGRRIASARSVDEALRIVAGELDGASARLESAEGLPLAPRQGKHDHQAPEERTLVSVPLHPRNADGQRVSVEVWPHEAPYAERVLEATAPVLSALVLEAQLRAMRDSLPALSLPALTGGRRPWELTAPTPGEARAAQGAPGQDPVADAHLAVCILAKHRKRVGAAVHQRWLQCAPATPLARTSDGWIAFVPSATPAEHGRFARALRLAFAEEPLPDVSIGYSRHRDTPGEAASDLREAWLAARVADAQPLCFDSVTASVLHRVLPADLARELVTKLLPELMADPGRDELVESMLAFLDSKGSVSGAARLLGVHRNTVQTRVRRAEELGVNLSAPDSVLPMHLLLRGVRPEVPETTL